MSDELMCSLHQDLRAGSPIAITVGFRKYLESFEICFASIGLRNPRMGHAYASRG